MGLRHTKSNDLTQISPEKWAESASEQEILQVIRKRGVEESAEIIRFVSPEKLRLVIDLDVWSNRAVSSGQRREVFNAKQFLTWIETLLETGSDEAVESLKGMGLEFCAGALAQYIDLTPMDVYAMQRAESGLATEDKDIEHGRALELGVFGQAYVLLKTSKSNKALRQVCMDDLREIMHELLAAFEEHAPEFLEGIVFHLSRLPSDAVALDDFEADRNLRIEQKGYTPAHKSYEHLLRFRKEFGLSKIASGSTDSTCQWSEESWNKFVQPWRLHSSLVSQGKEFSALRIFMEWAREQEDAQKNLFNRQWVFLANLIVSGWECNGQRFKPQSALKFLEAVISLGINLSLHSPDSKPRDLAELFENGWHYLYEMISLKAAQQFEKRLRIRHPKNQDIRETMFRFCSRNKVTNLSIVAWISSGNYKRVLMLIDDLQFGLLPECTVLLKQLLDPSPRIVVQGIENWIQFPGEETPAIARLEELLSDLRDPFER